MNDLCSSMHVFALKLSAYCPHQHICLNGMIYAHTHIDRITATNMLHKGLNMSKAPLEALV